ncbi:MAG: hypothetical protein CMH03_02895 [Marinovum sp.]|nr:hypothetical protein [Marinovum sp.]
MSIVPSLCIVAAALPMPDQNGKDTRLFTAIQASKSMRTWRRSKLLQTLVGGLWWRYLGRWPIRYQASRRLCAARAILEVSTKLVVISKDARLDTQQDFTGHASDTPKWRQQASHSPGIKRGWLHRSRTGADTDGAATGHGKNQDKIRDTKDLHPPLSDT